MNLPRNTCQWKLSGTETFRLSSTALLGKWGTNLTNIEKSMRSLYWADDGKILVQVDQSGAEALIVAWEAPLGKFRDLFLHGVKPHVFVAMQVFLDTWRLRCKDIDLELFRSAPIAELKKLEGWKELDTLIKSSDNWSAQERYYYIAKMICHASNYGMKAAAFQLNVLEKSRGKISLTKQQAEKYLADYHCLFPEIHAWHRAIEQQLRAGSTLWNLQGFPRLFTGPITDKSLKEAYAFVPQSTVGCITHLAITHMQRFIELERLDWDVLGNNHDSYLLQCPSGQEITCAKKMKELIEQELTSSRGEKFRMRSEAQVGRNWGPYKQGKNEEGLKEVLL